jgi:hypothetical protein
MFGSMYFVFQAKGFKSVCVSRQREGVRQPRQLLSEARKKLETEFSCFDWTIMRNIKFGQLYLDLAVTYTAFAERGPSLLTGIWSLDFLEYAHSTSGFRSGTLHRPALISAFGCLQAAATASTARGAGIFSRLSYNDYYVLYRLQSNQRSYISVEGAFYAEEEYLSQIRRVISILSDSMNRSSPNGCRDELRATVQCIDEDIAGALNKMVGSFYEFLSCLAESWLNFIPGFQHCLKQIDFMGSNRNVVRFSDVKNEGLH